ncbi:hemolysin XhlA [Pectobacterium sp. CHL-2024]|uniref:hemolysin XhlA n=1 Tax=Pectobacterium sp. CHL-2024 TaxID=3377079 RepID=UPI00381EB557
MGSVHDFKRGKTPAIENNNSKHHDSKHGDGNGGGDMESRVAKLESDVGHIQSTMADIKQDIRDIKADTKDFDRRLSNIEAEIKSAKTTFKACAAVITIIIGVAAYFFESYLGRVLDAVNQLVLK